MQKIEYIDINLLKPHPNNPRLIKDKPFEILCQSIKDNPDYFETRPILYNKDFIVFAGNMRLRAAQHIGMKQVPASLMDISEERQRELMIRDNVQNGEYDPQLLGAYFGEEELENWGVDMSHFGVFTPPTDDEITEKDKDKTPTIKVSFKTVADLEDAKTHIEQISARYAGSTISVSAGEI